MADIHDLLGPYVLDALDPDETSRFEVHLGECAACRAELAVLMESSADLAESVAAAPPARVKTLVLDAIADDTNSTVTSLRPGPRIGWLVAGAAAAIAIVFAGLWATTSSRLQLATQVAAVYEASDATIVDIDTVNGPARFVYSPSLGQGVFNGAGLSELSESEVYQLWLIDSDGPDPAGTLVSGDADVIVETIETGLTLAMTVEPAPGVAAPTSDPLFAAEL